jgi:hypothetical protein
MFHADVFDRAPAKHSFILRPRWTGKSYEVTAEARLQSVAAEMRTIRTPPVRVQKSRDRSYADDGWCVGRLCDVIARVVQR